jgi:hypothetical protein
VHARACARARRLCLLGWRRAGCKGLIVVEVLLHHWRGTPCRKDTGTGGSSGALRAALLCGQLRRLELTAATRRACDQAPSHQTTDAANEKALLNRLRGVATAISLQKPAASAIGSAAGPHRQHAAHQPDCEDPGFQEPHRFCIRSRGRWGFGARDLIWPLDTGPTPVACPQDGATCPPAKYALKRTRWARWRCRLTSAWERGLQQPRARRPPRARGTVAVLASGRGAPRGAITPRAPRRPPPPPPAGTGARRLSGHCKTSRLAARASACRSP